MDDNKGKLEIIPFEAVIDIPVSGFFYKKLQILKFAAAEQKPVEEYQKMLEHFQNGGEARDLYEAQQEVLLALLYEIEEQARKQEKMQYISPEELKIS